MGPLWLKHPVLWLLGWRYRGLSGTVHLSSQIHFYRDVKLRDGTFVGTETLMLIRRSRS